MPCSKSKLTGTLNGIAYAPAGEWTEDQIINIVGGSGGFAKSKGGSLTWKLDGTGVLVV